MGGAAALLDGLVGAVVGPFLADVVQPALTTRRGAERLRALTEHWIAYASAPLFPGGCFWAACLTDFDSRPGAVRDALARQRRTWLSLLAGEFRHAVEDGEVADVDPELAAFQVDAVLLATNTALRLGDDGAADLARRVLDGLLAGA
ncbi:TetR family transcriptional regulator C-terminal domain-containing protein [Kitasatospora sp. NPDC017646]|uniref:TetR family transcriptional regulator C-terminal domain-containing protein n=1 Tax=Kitasatospora sp. NPDC017646 TaxID=3364024 RepID=UPI0037B969A2